AIGPGTVKVRASYGESIRAPFPFEREGSRTPSSITLPSPMLGPERQRGADGGVDLYVGRASLAVTYYNQLAIDLIQLVTVAPPPGDTLPTSPYQNLNRVKHEGWEVEGRVP